jgi:hypothetical protein
VSLTGGGIFFVRVRYNKHVKMYAKLPLNLSVIMFSQENLPDKDVVPSGLTGANAPVI